MKKLIKFVCLSSTLFIGAKTAWADDNTRAFLPQSVPLPAVALVDDSSALGINPGGVGAKDLFEVYLSKSINPYNAGQFSIFAGIPNFSVGYQQFQASFLGDIRRFSLGWTYPVQDYLSLGLSYHLSQSLSDSNSNIHSFDLGLQFRPVRFLSLGFTARNLNTPMVQDRLIKRSYVAGLGIRPFGEKLTLTADAQWDEGDDVKAISGLFGLETEPLDGMLLRGSVDLKGQFMLGLGFQFNHINLGYYHTLNGTPNQDSAHLKLTSTTFNNAIQQIGNHFAYIDLNQGLILDSGEPSQPFLNRNQPVSYWHLLEQMRQVETMPRYKGIVLDVSALKAGLGTIEEIHTALRRIRAAGKQIIVYLRDGGMSEYYFASVADKIVLHPMGSLHLKGFAYVLPHYKDLLDQVGVEVEFIKVGNYKTGMESYTRSESSPGTVEEYTSIQKDDFDRYLANLKATRHLDNAVIDKVFQKTLFTATEAKETGLIDAIAYADEIPQIAADLIHQPTASFEDISRTRFNDASWEPRDKVAVVYISGSIVEGQSGRGFLFGEEFAGSASIVRQISALQEDPRVKGLVLRVNSPGGSALASDEIYRALQLYKKHTKNPVIVSMADVAASGGYWIALAGDQILANASTMTGSIGIFAGKTNLKGLFDLLGIKHTVIKSNEKADSTGEHRGYTEAERQIVQNNLREFYRIFLERVSENRKLDFATVEQVAQGRVYTGKQALDIHLIDKIGGLSEAIALARSLAKINTQEIEIEHLPEMGNLFSNLPLPAEKMALIPEIKASVERVFPSALSVLALMDPSVDTTP
jgi:protease IV